MNILCLLLAVLSIWDYPSRQQTHDRLRETFVAAMRAGNTRVMEATCRKGVQLLPDDPTWHYNLACSLAYFENRENEALNELEMAIDLGYRDRKMIENDADLKRLSKLLRYEQLLEYADFMRSRPLLSGPMVTVDATGVFGHTITLGEQNLAWNFDAGCFDGCLKLAQSSSGGSEGDIYINRDGNHARIALAEFPGLSEVKFDSEGQKRKMNTFIPNLLLPYPVFGNCSMAHTDKVMWRSISRTLTTTQLARLKSLQSMYLGNQVWVFPVNADTPPIGTNGDVIVSLTPYWINTAGRSWSDLPYLRGALEASRSFSPQVKRQLVATRMLAPVIGTLIRKSLRDVKSEDDYLTAAAHPTAMPPGALDTNRLGRAAAALKVEAIPPLVPVKVEISAPAKPVTMPELLFGTPFAWGYVIRSDESRMFTVRARGAEVIAFRQTHGVGADLKIERLGRDKDGFEVAEVTVPTMSLNPTNRVDLMITGRNPGTGWGAPSYVSFARVDPDAPYSDPVLTPRKIRK